MLLKYLESCLFTVYVVSQIPRTPSWNLRQLMASGSYDSVPVFKLKETSKKSVSMRYVSIVRDSPSSLNKLIMSFLNQEYSEKNIIHL